MWKKRKARQANFCPVAAGIPAAILYMYDSNSVFSIIVNRYMSEGTPIIPGSGRIDGTGNGTGSAVSLSLLMNMTRRLGPNEVKLLDSS